MAEPTLPTAEPVRRCYPVTSAYRWYLGFFAVAALLLAALVTRDYLLESARGHPHPPVARVIFSLFLLLLLLGSLLLALLAASRPLVLQGDALYVPVLLGRRWRVLTRAQIQSIRLGRASRGGPRPIVLALADGRSLTLSWIFRRDAHLDAWFRDINPQFPLAAL